MESDGVEYGPAMAALTEKQRRFVLAMVEVPGGSFAAAARRAGYSDTKEGAKVRGHHLAHSGAIQDAIREEAGKRLNASSLAAAAVLMELLGDKKVDPKDRIKAAGMLLDRTGFGASQTINVNKTVTKRIDASQAEAKIAEFRHKFPEMFAKLVGSPAPVLDGEAVEVSK